MILPNPRALDDSTRRALEASFRLLAEHPVAATAGELERPQRWALDELVFDLLGLSATERAAVREALVACLAVRRRRVQQAVGEAKG
jgi:hypothetical protein